MTHAQRPGTFVAIPLADGTVGYGRVLAEPYMAFYDYPTDVPSADLDGIASKPLLFTQAVRLDDPARWPELGWRELQGEVAKPVVRFTQDPFDFRKCTIFDSEGGEWPARPEDCVGLERAAVWDMHHIEARLLDTFMGLPNEAEVSARVRLE